MMATFWINIYTMYFRLPAVGQLFLSHTSDENNNLITMDIVNN